MRACRTSNEISFEINKIVNLFFEFIFRHLEISSIVKHKSKLIYEAYHSMIWVNEVE